MDTLLPVRWRDERRFTILLSQRVPRMAKRNKGDLGIHPGVPNLASRRGNLLRGVIPMSVEKAGQPDRIDTGLFEQREELRLTRARRSGETDVKPANALRRAGKGWAEQWGRQK